MVTQFSNRHTSAAGTPALLTYICILWTVLMVTRAMRAAQISRYYRVVQQHIFAMGESLQVVGIDARMYAALVMYLFTLWNWTNEKFIRCYVPVLVNVVNTSVEVLRFAEKQIRIIVTRLRARPYPAPRLGVHFELPQESFDDRLTLGSHEWGIITYAT